MTDGDGDRGRGDYPSPLSPAGEILNLHTLQMACPSIWHPIYSNSMPFCSSHNTFFVLSIITLLFYFIVSFSTLKTFSNVGVGGMSPKNRAILKVNLLRSFSMAFTALMWNQKVFFDFAHFWRFAALKSVLASKPPKISKIEKLFLNNAQESKCHRKGTERVDFEDRSLYLLPLVNAIFSPNYYIWAKNGIFLTMGV